MIMRRRKPVASSGSCAICSQAALCRGGCTASSVAFHGKTGVNENCLRLAELKGK